MSKQDKKYIQGLRNMAHRAGGVDQSARLIAFSRLFPSGL